MCQQLLQCCEHMLTREMMRMLNFFPLKKTIPIAKLNSWKIVSEICLGDNASASRTNKLVGIMQISSTLSIYRAYCINIYFIGRSPTSWEIRNQLKTSSVCLFARDSSREETSAFKSSWALSRVIRPIPMTNRERVP